MQDKTYRHITAEIISTCKRPLNITDINLVDDVVKHMLGFLEFMRDLGSTYTDETTLELYQIWKQKK